MSDMQTMMFDLPTEPVKVDPAVIRFDGATFDPARDAARLTGQWLRVFGLMRDGKWRTLQEVAAATGDPEASVSARIRDFRKERFGGHDVQRRRRGDGGTFEYRILTA